MSSRAATNRQRKKPVGAVREPPSPNLPDAEIEADYSEPEPTELISAQASSPNPALRFVTGPYPTLISRLVLGGIFLLSGMSKLGVPSTFAESINSYEMSLPDPLVQLMSVGLPPLEIGLGVWLLVGLFTRFSAALTGGLMLVFLVAMLQAWARGLDPNCGCFAGAAGNPLGTAMIDALGPIGVWLTRERVGPESVTRDIVFLLMAVHLMLVPTVFSLDNLRRREHNA